MTSELLTPKDLAARLELSTSQLSKMRYLGSGPRFVKLGSGGRSSVRYRASDVEAWLDSQTREQSGNTVSA